MLASFTARTLRAEIPAGEIADHPHRLLVEAALIGGGDVLDGIFRGARVGDGQFDDLGLLADEMVVLLVEPLAGGVIDGEAVGKAGVTTVRRKLATPGR